MLYLRKVLVGGEEYGKIEIFRLFGTIINMMYNSCMIFFHLCYFIFLSPLGVQEGQKKRWDIRTSRRMKRGVEEVEGERIEVENKGRIVTDKMRSY
jgi:hypothetical protein